MKILFSLAVLLFSIMVIPIQADAARVDILPRKIVMTDRERSTDITILNLGDKASFVRVTLISYKQDQDGHYEDLTGPLNPAFDPEKVVRFSPKQFTLPAGGRQKIRLAVQRPADLPDGEYRFHVKALSFDQEDASVRRDIPENSSVALKMNVGVVIPVVVYKGKATSDAKIKNVSLLSSSQLAQGVPTLTFDIVREGQSGVLGTLRAYQDQGGKPTEIGMISNMNVFSETPQRHVEMPLAIAPAAGPIRLVYTNDFGDKNVIDEVVLQK